MTKLPQAIDRIRSAVSRTIDLCNALASVPESLRELEAYHEETRTMEANNASEEIDLIRYERDDARAALEHCRAQLDWLRHWRVGSAPCPLPGTMSIIRVNQRGETQVVPRKTLLPSDLWRPLNLDYHHQFKDI